MVGNIHSFESFGTVDGPGIRFVVFMQGCPMRCLYCHNPDTWDISVGEKFTAEEVLERYRKNSAFYKNGGITVTGGEPLLQIDFLTELFIKAKEEKIHTCIDTSGVTFNPENTEKLDRLMKYTDLVMLDIKHINDERHKQLTGYSNNNILLFAKHLEELNIPLWIRHVVVPGISDNADDLNKLGNYIGRLKNLRSLEVLPYHTLGVAKYNNLGIDYPLKNIKPLSKDEANTSKKYILDGIEQVRKNNCGE